MKQFSDEFIARLNATHSGGVFVKAAIVDLGQLSPRYFADVQGPLTFAGHTYTPLPMQWRGRQASSSMSLSTVQVTVPDITGEIDTFLQGSSLLGNDMTLQLLHRDLLAVVSNVDALRMQVMNYTWNWTQATFTLGHNIGLSEQIPRFVVSKKIFPGTKNLFRRASIL